jgi:hypothetical protein
MDAAAAPNASTPAAAPRVGVGRATRRGRARANVKISDGAIHHNALPTHRDTIGATAAAAAAATECRRDDGASSGTNQAHVARAKLARAGLAGAGVARDGSGSSAGAKAAACARLVYSRCLAKSVVCHRSHHAA